MARGERAGAGGRNQLARLLAEIGVASDAEARAVISDILNQQTDELTEEQQSLLGTGIYRDIAALLDIPDAAGEPITRTSDVTLPSGAVVELSLIHI